MGILALVWLAETGDALKVLNGWMQALAALVVIIVNNPALSTIIGGAFVTIVGYLHKILAQFRRNGGSSAKDDLHEIKKDIKALSNQFASYTELSAETVTKQGQKLDTLAETVESMAVRLGVIERRHDAAVVEHDRRHPVVEGYM